MRHTPALLTTILSAAMMTATPASAQDTAAPPAAAPADVASPDAIIGALYDVISGPAGEARDWDRMRSLFLPDARLIPTGVRGDGTRAHRIMSVEEYIDASGSALERDGFFEIETHRVTEQFGNILHAFSTYESRRTEQDEQPFMRGINSIQLFDGGTRWWIVNVFWDAERPDNLIPAKYLP